MDRLPLRPLTLAATFALGLLAMPAAQAQAVYKCNLAGNTTYQSAPCADKGREIEIKAGPSEEQIREARSRADAERARAAAVVAALPQPSQSSQTLPSGVNCGQLNQARAEAYGNRNATVRNSRQSNIDQSAAVVQQQNRIAGLESRMNRGGCKLN